MSSMPSMSSMNVNVSGLDVKQKLVLQSLVVFYSNPQNIRVFCGIITKKVPLSLRLIDFLVTRYADQHPVIFLGGGGGNSTVFNLYESYKNELRSYNKRLFDPFRRKTRILFEYSNGRSTFSNWTGGSGTGGSGTGGSGTGGSGSSGVDDAKDLDMATFIDDDAETSMSCRVVTTIAQLNFFRWAIQYGIVHYALTNMDKIDVAMNEATTLSPQEQVNGDRDKEYDNDKNKNGIVPPKATHMRQYMVRLVLQL